MKHTIILLIFSGMSFFLSAQKNDWFNGTLKELFSLIQAKHNVRFMYSNNDIDDSRIVSLEINPELKVLMDNISKEAEIVYEIKNNQIVIRSLIARVGEGRNLSIDNGKLKIENEEIEREEDLKPKETELSLLQISKSQDFLSNIILTDSLSVISALSTESTFIKSPVEKIASEQKKLKISFPEIFSNEPSVKLKTREISLHTNLLYDLILTPNIGFGYKMNETFELLLDGAWSRLKWNNESRTFRLQMISSEFRVYPFNKKCYYFGGIYHVGATNIKLGENGYQGYFMGGGITTGYVRELNKNFSIDFGLGFGCVWFDYESYIFADKTNQRKDSQTDHFWMPLKANVSLVWKIKTSRKLSSN